MKTSARIYFVTGSKFKYREIADYIPGIEMLAVPNLPELQSLDLQEVIKAKLRSARDAVGESDYLVVEDTALHLCSLRGFPGPLIKFLLARLHNEGIYNLCKKLGDRKATAECAFGLFTPSVGTMEIAIARKTGTICRPRGQFGFGWDRIFVPTGSTRTFAEMESIKEKNRFSMRSRALQRLLLRMSILGILNPKASQNEPIKSPTGFMSTKRGRSQPGR